MLAKNAACVLSDRIKRAGWQMKIMWRICLQVAILDRLCLLLRLANSL